jgi:hypothetical protein
MKSYTVINPDGKKHYITAESVWHAISKAVYFDQAKFRTNQYKTYAR